MPESKVLQHDPLSEADKILREEYYGRSTENQSNGTPVTTAAPVKKPRKKQKPTHYKVVCISMYLKDIENLEAKVAELKRRGYTKANKSQLIRYALDQLDIEDLPVPLDPLERR